MAFAQRIVVASARPLPRARVSNKRYICLNCQLRALSIHRKSLSPYHTRNVTRSQLRRYADQRPNNVENDDGFEGSFANKVRKKLWGTDTPPGQRNPYVRESLIDEEEEDRLREEAEMKAREIEEADFARIREGVDRERILAGEQDVIDDVAEEEEEEGEDYQGEAGDGEESREKRTGQQYIPAKTWRGLRFIPGWKVVEQKPKPWFEGFLAPEKVETANGIDRAIQRALVEVWIMKQETGTFKLPAKISDPTDDFIERLATGVGFNRDMSVNFTDGALREEIAASLGLRDTDGTAVDQEEEKLDHVPEGILEGSRFGKNPYYSARTEMADSDSHLEDEVIDEFDTESPEDVIAAEETDNLIADEVKPRPAVDQSYRQVAFEQHDVKFAVLKRVMQLTGTRIPDPSIPRLNTAASLFHFLIKPPPAKHLVDDLRENTTLEGLPNVHISAERWTMKKKEVEIGRWKLIEAELDKRGIPSEPELATMQKEMGAVPGHVLPYLRQKEKTILRRRR